MVLYSSYDARRIFARNPYGRALFCDAALLDSPFGPPKIVSLALARAKAGDGAAVRESQQTHL